MVETSQVTVGVPRERTPGERRVALVADTCGKLVKAGYRVLVESGAGEGSGISDTTYKEKGAEIVASASSLLQQTDVLLKVRPPLDEEIPLLRENSVLIAMLDARSNTPLLEKLAARHVTAFSMELMPRITRAQVMDVLSSQSSLAGYKCVLEAAVRLPKIFPMMMTAAGTLPPARVFVIGAGVAGLQAIATARRLGGVVEAYDVRPAVKEEVQSLGGRFVELALESKDLADKGGYAKAAGEEFLQKQRELMTKHCAHSDVVITTALIPGKKAPVLVTAEMVAAMKPGSVLVDLAAEQGGNCPLSKPGEDVIVGGVTIVGMKDVASGVSSHASLAYARNVCAYLLHLTKDGRVALDLEDELTSAPLATHEGKVTVK